MHVFILPFDKDFSKIIFISLQLCNSKAFIEDLYSFNTEFIEIDYLRPSFGLKNEFYFKALMR